MLLAEARARFGVMDEDVMLAEGLLRYAVARDRLEPDGRWSELAMLAPLLAELDRLREAAGETGWHREARR